MALLTLADLRAMNPANLDESRAQALIEDATSFAVVRLPALSGALTVDQQDAVRGILREQVLHRYAHGDGNVSQQSAGPFSVTIDSRSTRAPIVSDHALNRLREVLGINAGYAFSVDTTPSEVETL
jgi:hypothetical protein